ncbi:6476_t:CDS:2 [Paraglomus brasilianum]|uniref:6476_t:CDS:1 n=1 Tax=Paraglomus brasilianum TaxID=144538 RepID=A0A9N9H7V9_9GLOM|nr:6476_t:CDS:2 [Paraglomus brasilianum]
MSHARYSSDIWWARNLDRFDELVHKYPKLPTKPVEESSLPLKIGSKITIKNYNTFLENHGSAGYKFWFDKKTSDVFIIGMASTKHEAVISLLQRYFNVPNNGVVVNPPICVYGQPRLKIAPDVAVYPNIAFVPRPSASPVIPVPPSDLCGNPHARIVCEIAISQDVGRLGQRCLRWMKEKYVRAVIGIKILEERPMIREPVTGYFYKTMTAKLYRQGMDTQRWDFGNAKKYSRDPVNNPADCNAPNLPAFQITIPISEVFWDLPLFPIPLAYAPAVPATIVGNTFVIDLYQIQRIVLEANI